MGLPKEKIAADQHIRSRLNARLCSRLIDPAIYLNIERGKLSLYCVPLAMFAGKSDFFQHLGNKRLSAKTRIYCHKEDEIALHQVACRHRKGGLRSKSETCFDAACP